MYTYCANNPLIYYDPTGHNFVTDWWGNKKAEWQAGWEALTIPEKREEAFKLIDEYGDLGYIEKRELAVKVAYLDMVKGIVDTGKNVLDSGVVQFYMLEAGRKLGVGGLDDDTVYQITRDTINEKLANEKKVLDELPQTMVKAVVKDLTHVINPKNAYNYFLNPDAQFGELVDYSKSTINTGMTVYGGAKLLQSGANVISNIKISTPSTLSVSNSMATIGRSITVEAALAGNNGWMTGAGWFGAGSVDSYINYATGNDVGFSKANPEKVVNALSDFKSKKWTFGNENFTLDKSGMKHILERHHPKYWEGSIKSTQTFLDKSLSIDDIVNIADDVLKQNRNILIEKGTTGMYQVEGVVNGVDYVVGLNKGRVGQLYKK